MYHKFNIKQIYVLPTQCIYVFYMDLKTANISLYSIKWLVFIRETEPFKAQWLLYVPQV